MTNHFVWIESTGMWNFFMNYPKNECQEYQDVGLTACAPSMSGPYAGACKGSPKSPQEWPIMDASFGCERLTALDCKNRSDGFMTVTLAELPKLHAIVYANISQDECRGSLKKCSCQPMPRQHQLCRTRCVIWVTELIDLRMSSHPTQDIFVRL
ncbi:receptor-like serine/threonine-protein kinase SD1-8 [Dioscorea cayenensis subsp. rotundata]|uniref:Receptor-like serine/threonine-protein kinase SD1-8 n=1 Tax=Dioscorea cayennensis subsp. rotundata TaxID=55577 RepID=A0AB40AY39_DIOCR|nr:receptor-like serine/threonine-protein kinase SD1-8 [Dioscorea cayenensis subsp. rotundata]